MSSLKENKELSFRAFRDIIMPKASELWFGSMPVPIESELAQPCQDLDMACGVDWQVRFEGVYRFIGARAQFGKKAVHLLTQLPFNTFSFRAIKPSGADTEFQHYTDAIEKDGVRAYYCIQAYLNSRSFTGPENILSMALGKVTDVMWMIKMGFYKLLPNHEDNDETWFTVVRWDKMIENNKEVKIFENPNRLRILQRGFGDHIPR